MKPSSKILSVLIMFLIAGAFLAFSGAEKEKEASGDLQEVISDTISNSIVKTGYVVFDKDKIVDSVQFIQYSKGELDVDLFIGIRAFSFEDTPGHFLFKNHTSVAGDSTTLTTNLDSAVTSVTHVVTWPASKLVGANALYCSVTAASSGNDAGDANLLMIWAKIFYRPD